ncbi:aspartyl protease family protein [Carboxylicivirga sediminis]|uniref:Aspartyl protease family protein n=1 Tax=Carboxylicivirga sediminis TaxID=2006564 RepID=A0A941IWK0_9BACT|nr:aspartyl protease family protein [Carboxylicivirga sediminis]MBR8534643.1 aspartyl protease family protein [Carboxylicivirga sediminis]
MNSVANVNINANKNTVLVLTIVLLLFMQQSIVCGQFNEGQPVTDNFYTEIPFEYLHDKIVIEANMNGIKGRYLLDTGAMCVLFKDSTNQQYDNSSKIRIGDATGKKQMAEVVRMPLIEVGDLQYEDIPVMYVDMFAGPFKCLGYKGIIGSNLLRFGAFKIDWHQKKLVITDSFQTLGKQSKQGAKMHVNKQQSSPFIKCKINSKNIGWVLLDTGSGDIFSLYNPTASWLTKKKAIGQPDYVSSGTNSHGAWGAGDYETSIYCNSTLQIGITQFQSVSLETSDGKSKIGMKMLEQGNFILDYPQKRFFIEVDENSNDLAIESFGIDLIMKDDLFIVNGIWKGTAAEESGIEKGDIVEDIEGVNLKDKSSCEVFLTIKALTKAKDELTFYLLKPDGSESRKVTLPRLKI